jgi:hypothetical protein
MAHSLINKILIRNAFGAILLERALVAIGKRL